MVQQESTKTSRSYPIFFFFQTCKGCCGLTDWKLKEQTGLIIFFRLILYTDEFNVHVHSKIKCTLQLCLRQGFNFPCDSTMLFNYPISSCNVMYNIYKIIRLLEFDSFYCFFDRKLSTGDEKVGFQFQSYIGTICLALSYQVGSTAMYF